MATNPPTATAPATPGADTVALERAARRLQAWEARHAEAAVLAMLASLAVRIDSALLRRLRLLLLPRAEPGIEADVWFSGLHESRGRDAAVLDAGVQRLLRARLAGQPVDADGRRPLDLAWQITAALHAEAPEALRKEEELTWVALRGGADLPARIEVLLAPALAAMANGGDTRALEVARWAQRAVPRLPDAARTHPSALALWLAALMRLGMPGSRLPDTGEAGLPPALQWLLPAGQLQALQRVALTPFDDALQLQPLADDAPAADNEITLPRTQPLLLALRALPSDVDAAPLLQRTASIDAAAAETRVPLPADWQAVELNSLTGEQWRLQRAPGAENAGEQPLLWQQMQVLVLNGRGAPSGVGVFVSPTEVVTVIEALDASVQRDLRDDANLTEGRHVALDAIDGRGKRHSLRATALVLDLRSPLVLLRLTVAFSDAVAPVRADGWPARDSEGWIAPSLLAGHGLQTVQLRTRDVIARSALAEDSQDAQARRFVVALPGRVGPVPAGGLIFAGRRLVGITEAATQQEASVAVPAQSIDRFLNWAHQPESERPSVLLHYPVDDPYGKGAENDKHAVRRIEAAAERALVRLLQRDAGQQTRQVIDDPDDPVFAPDLAAALRLVTPVTNDDAAPAARLRMRALAARRWARPDFGVLTLGHRRSVVNEAVPTPLTDAPRQSLDKFHDHELARALLELTDTAPSGAEPSPEESPSRLLRRLHDLARPFQPSALSLQPVTEALNRGDLPAVADLIVGRWNVSSRLDAVPLVEHLAMMAAPLPPEPAGLLALLRDAERGALVLNAMPVQFARLLIARAHAGRPSPPCIVIRSQNWGDMHILDFIEGQVIEALASALGCNFEDAFSLFKRLDLPVWVLITTRPLPDKDTLLQLELRLPSARFLFLAGDQPDLADAARAIGAEPLPPIEPGADMRWLQGYKRLMQWARPRKPSTTQPGRRPTKAVRKPARK